MNSRNGRRFFYTHVYKRTLTQIKESRNTHSHAQSTNTLWKNQQTQKAVIRNQHHSAEKQQWGDEEKWEMEEKKKKTSLGRDAWKERSRRVSSLPDRFTAEPNAEGGRITNMKRLCSVLSKVYKINFITALQTLQDQHKIRADEHHMTNTKIKQYFNQKLKFCHPLLFQTCTSFFLLWNTKERFSRTFRCLFESI